MIVELAILESHLIPSIVIIFILDRMSVCDHFEIVAKVNQHPIVFIQQLHIIEIGLVVGPYLLLQI